MLRLRYGATVPPGAVNLGYVSISPATPQTHLNLSDFSVDIPENIANVFGTDTEIDLSTETAETDEFVLSNRSVLSRNVRRPSALFYQVTLSQFVVEETATPGDLEAARAAIQKHLVILDGAFRATTDLQWDLTVDATGPVDNSYTVTLYTDRIGTRGQSFVVRYHAVDTNGTRTPNYREVLNPSPSLTAGTQYTVTDDGDNGFTINNVAASTMGPAIGLFLDPTGPATATVSATAIDFGGGDSVGLQVSGVYRSVEEVVADINAANIAVTAVALSRSPTADLAVGTYTLTSTGTVIRLRNQVHLRYTDLFRVRPQLPAANNPREPWYPQVSTGSFRRFVASSGRTLIYRIRDFAYQAFSTTAGSPYKAAVFETPTPIDARRLQVRHAPIRAASDVTVLVDGLPNTTLVDQVDLANGVLFLTRAVGPNIDLRVSYLYEARTFVYRGVNCNPTLKQSPDLLGKYIGVYLLPYQIIEGAVTSTFERTVFHLVRNTAQEIIDLVPALTLIDGSSAEALLLGIYHVVQTEVPETLPLIDTRTPGGGLRSDLTPEDVAEEEARFYSDVGGHWDGEPFPDAGTLIVEIPNTIPGTGQAETHHTNFDSMGVTGVLDLTGWVNPTGLLTTDQIHSRITRHPEGGAFVIEDLYQL